MMVGVGRLEQHSNIGWPVSVRDNDAAKMLRVNCEWCKEKKNLAVSSMLHEAKIEYCAFDVTVYCMYTHQTCIAYKKRTH
jgi:hypothetical protein